VSARSSKQTPEKDPGSRGASAVREYERRRAQREERARARLGPLGQALARLISDPQSTRAWKQGADAEIRVAQQLANHLQGGDVVLLHDRRIPSRGRANIDHLAIGPGGITVIDTRAPADDCGWRSAAASSPHATKCCSSTDATAPTWSTGSSVRSRPCGP
jgi:hypothetical protein